MRNVNVIPTINQFGMTTITLTVSDGVKSAQTAFMVSVTAVDAPPTITPISNQVINEDTPSAAIPFTVGGIGPFTISGVSDDQLLIPDGNIAIAGSGTDWTVQVTPLPNANGVANINITVNDVGAGESAQVSFEVTVTAVNDVPSFTKGANQTVNEDAAPQTVNGWATAIADGDPELTQTISFNVTNDNNPLFSVQPAITAAGDLSYTLAANVNGLANVSVSVSDDGSNAFPNVNTSAVQMFTINVTAVNDVPSFTKGLDQTILEGAGPQTVNGWASAISDGDPDLVQTLTFNVSNNNNALFTAQPAISAAGVLTYTAVASANGTANVTVTLSDNGSDIAPNVNTSAAQVFVITVNAINDAPTFTKGADQSVQEDVGAQNVNGWATAIDDGDADVVQTLTFDVTNNNNSLFSVQPSITSGGDLSYTPAANHGTAIVSVTLMDDGSGIAPNVNTSPQQTFNIVITPLNDAPVFTPGTNVTVDESSALKRLTDGLPQLATATPSLRRQ